MYKLIRRISSSFFPRPDRPWDDDATSNAPQIGKKRRMSDDEDEPSTPSIKKSRTGLLPKEGEVIDEEGSPQAEKDETAEGVKEVTKGVREVELEETKKTVDGDVAPAAEEAAAVPLPESPVLRATASELATSEVVGETAESGEKSDQSDVAKKAEDAEETKETVADTDADADADADTEPEEDVAHEKETIVDATLTSDDKAAPTTHASTEEEDVSVVKAKEGAEVAVDAA